MKYKSVDWSSILELSDASPSGLVWKIRPSRGTLKGSVAGSICIVEDRASWQIGFKRRTYICSRVIMTMLGFDITGLMVDHEDGNALNNKPSNLRVVTDTVNNLNTKLNKRNTSGHKCITEPYKGDFMVTIIFAGVRSTKYFSKKLFLEPLQEAIKYRDSQRLLIGGTARGLM